MTYLEFENDFFFLWVKVKDMRMINIIR